MGRKQEGRGGTTTHPRAQRVREWTQGGIAGASDASTLTGRYPQQILEAPIVRLVHIQEPTSPARGTPALCFYASETPSWLRHDASSSGVLLVFRPLSSPPLPGSDAIQSAIS